MSSKLEKQASSEATFLAFIRRQFIKPKPLPASIKLTGQVAIVTGSNVGLGLEASRQLLQLGLHHLVIGVRSQAKGDAAAAELRAAFPSAIISVWLLDMESYDSIREFVDKCATLPRIDITILNAGLISNSYAIVSTTKHETTLQVNYLSTALLTILLLPILKSKKITNVTHTKPPVLSIVASDLAYSAKLDTKSPLLQQFNNPKTFQSFPWYANSKLLLIFFVTKLAELASPDDVIVNIVNPGMTKGTSFFRRASWIFMKLMAVAQFLLARSVVVGASIYLDATLAHGKESHGSFVSEWRIMPYPKVLYTQVGQEVKEKLWDETFEELHSAGASKETLKIFRRVQVYNNAEGLSPNPRNEAYCHNSIRGKIERKTVADV